MAATCFFVFFFESQDDSIYLQFACSWLLLHFCGFFRKDPEGFLTRVGPYYSYKWNYNPKKAGCFHPSWAPVIFGPFTNGYTVTLPCRTVTINGVSFLVPLIGGSMVVAYNHPIGKDYKWLYVRGIYCQRGDYMLPTMLPPIKGTIETAFETTHTIHGTGIFTYMKTIKINHSWIGKYAFRPMDPSWAMSPCGQVVRLMRVFRFVLALRSLISSIAETFLGFLGQDVVLWDVCLGGKVVACTVNVCRILENYPWTQFKGWFSWKQLIIHWFNWFVNPTSCTLPRRMFLKSHCCQRSTLLDHCEENWKSWGWSPYFGLYACWVSLSMYLQCSSRLLGSKSFR